ncbi:MAG: hypothetical protein STSR0008_24550 [Ignavibacterium sp.]
MSKKSSKIKTKNIIENQSNKSKKNIPKSILVIGIVIILAIVIVIIINSDKETSTTDSEYQFHKEGKLTILDSNKVVKKKIDIEIADTEYDRELGLMFRKEMSDEQGMLFIFPVEDNLSFWMRNTYIPLDMIFIDSQKRIITIHKNTIPLSEDSYRSSAPAKYVLEVNGGFTDRFNIKEGDFINW